MGTVKIIVFTSYCVILIIIGFWSVRKKRTNVKNFFLLSSRISDINGYDLEPDNCVEASSENETETISRDLEGKPLAVLMTHETGYKFKTRPENWDQIFNKTSQGISNNNPATSRLLKGRLKYLHLI